MPSLEHIHKSNVFSPNLPDSQKQHVHMGSLYGAATGLLISHIIEQSTGPVVVVTPNMASTSRLETELNFFASESFAHSILPFPDWETLPYDVFSPHQDIIAQRLETLYRLPNIDRGCLIITAAMLMQRLPPREFLAQNTFLLTVGDTLNLDKMRATFEHSGYTCVSQVMEHGEFAVRGSIIDVFPTGSNDPIRIDLFDNEVESIRFFDPETQRTISQTNSIKLLPAREFPFTKEAIQQFRQEYRETFAGDPQRSTIYKDVSNSILPNGIEYYFPLFFNTTETLFDHLPNNTLFLSFEGFEDAAETFYSEVCERYEQRRHDIERAILAPTKLFLSSTEVSGLIHKYSKITLQNFAYATPLSEKNSYTNFESKKPPKLLFNPRHENAASSLAEFVQNYDGRILFAAESEGRREALLELLKDNHIQPRLATDWQYFINGNAKIAITIAPLEDGLWLTNPNITIISEPQIFGDRVSQRRRRKAPGRDSNTIIQNLTELTVGAAVVHQDHGVGRYLGLQILEVGGSKAEFLTLEYAESNKLYVPVASLHLIHRYTGSDPEKAPLHRLGSDQWDKAKRKAAEKVRDVAAELLEIYARRATAKGIKFDIKHEEYNAFAAAFQFEETPDQESTINAVLSDMEQDKPMDRVVCGDVGFGKTEVAMRATFIAVDDNKQVAILVPTTLLAQQHYRNFQDRFANWPFRVAVLSRFNSKKEQDEILAGIASGHVDIIIGTHKLIQENVIFRNMGLVIVDEEQRFGVRQKDKIKAKYSGVDMLTLTATPIPRTLNMALSGLRDLSIIATPPAHRLAVKTFVTQWDNATIKEAFLREIKRGGQVYFLHNDVSSIEKMTRELAELLPEAKIEFAHGQMREKELEHVMMDFYHRRFNVLVASTIIESGIDIPTANTIIINRADKLGLAQLHQLRGRVGRSHHRAYAYLLIPPRKSLTPDALKRLEAIESLEDLGAGFMLASHDLEIRGAGELLGDGQSGQIQEIGFNMYNDLLARAVQALKDGKQPELDRPLDHGAEIEFAIPALLPEDYIADVHIRLTIYKRIASCTTHEELRELQVEMIDRFGLLPEHAKNLILITEIKLKANPLGIIKIDMHAKGGRIIFQENPNIDPMKIIQLIQTRPKQYQLDGQNKLKIIREFSDIAEKLRCIEGLLKTLEN